MYNIPRDLRVQYRDLVIIILSQTHVTLFTRCTPFVVRSQKMQAIQCKHPSETQYRTVKLIDPVDVEGKHYAVAVDICDKRTTDILLSFLNVLNRKDSVTLITFGHRACKYDFTMEWHAKHKYHMSDMLSREETGLNILVGIRYLEQVEAEQHIMITAGYQDSGPIITKHMTKLFYDIIFFSPGGVNSEKFIPGWAPHFYFPKHGPHERTIREALFIKPPQYYDICIQGLDPMDCPPISYGGYRMVELPFKTESRLNLSCMLFDGTFQECECELQDDETLPFNSDIMKPCAMVE